jgi:16S rRNA (guanine527-N7)-methyltransferase
VALPAMPELDERQLDQLTAYLGLVQQYKKVAGLTALRTTADLVEELAVDSLRLLALGDLTPGACLLDLGSGSGSPVVPLAVACPDAACWACEANERKASFLRQCAVQVRLANLTVLEQRAETVDGDCAGGWDVVTSRAFAPLAALLPLAAKMVVSGAELRGYLGPETEELRQLAGSHGFALEQLVAYNSAGKPRHLYLLRKC